MREAYHRAFETLILQMSKTTNEAFQKLAKTAVCILHT
jgi:hypothetical protein